ncbi:hypothetical protein GTY67_18630 [Streptomyces sp. SID8374]|uniref:hypothetical protein n=1 Tax=Streptomyces sp. SID8374 TaxID=2690354 RepID=UPI00136B29FE|nr:hypothetical protein [Streptomyces sp. SID8374]MYX15379.1 hypothetical protein [Streptomyces sp. SID8374]
MRASPWGAFSVRTYDEIPSTAREDFQAASNSTSSTPAGVQGIDTPMPSSSRRWVAKAAELNWAWMPWPTAVASSTCVRRVCAHR